MSIVSSLTRTNGRKLLTSLAALGAAGAVAGLGSWAAFTSSTSASTQVDSGSVTASLGTAGSASNRLTIGASGIVPGDTIQRAVTLSNSGDTAWDAAALTTSATTSSLLDTDATDGLQLQVDSCDQAWTEAGTAPAYTYTCAGTTTPVIASRAVIGSGLGLGAINALNPSGADYLRVTLTLPTTAGNAFQAQSSTIDFAFDAAQRTGTNR